MTKGGVIVRKKEMTRLPIGNALTAVTLLQLVPQEVVSYRTQEKDGYVAVVVGAQKKERSVQKGKKFSYARMVEFPCDSDFIGENEVGVEIAAQHLQGSDRVHVAGVSKGKGFQGVMKRHGAKGGPATHGSKFHRHIGSLGNRKPRRVMKGHPHHGHMGSERVTLRNVPLVDVIEIEGETLVAVKGSVPGGYNSYLTLELV